ncbi:hypothetical protein [Allosalinactinospora lopnorensis]|uniref:hypothetical protein n=1 Tax=Allosalinactinospora lopnorensis TaxID=1352348 RepID=UPI000AE4C396|nr:hypothetical protein [Allosalinactinospora lopnorensis]
MVFPRSTTGTRRIRPLVRGAVGTVLGAVAARAAYGVLARSPARDTVDDVFKVAEHSRDVWTRTNFRGEEVTLLEGPALAAGTCAAAALTPGVPPRLRTATVVAALGATAFGGYDDLSGTGASRGFRGHLGALARGEITTGAIKIAGIGATGLVAAALLDRRPADTAINGALIAGTANLLNLLDLRPGRAAKAGLLAGAPALTGPASGIAGSVVGATAALLPEDLGERAMLGDAGANVLGAVLGVTAAASLPRPARAGILGGVIGLTLASEFISFTRVIDRVPPLRRLDELGRRRAPEDHTAPEETAPPAPDAEPVRVIVPPQRGSGSAGG